MEKIPSGSAPRRRDRSSIDRLAVHSLFDLLGQRWALRIIWELRGTPLGFRPLQTACDDVSPSVLNQRLHELRRARLVARSADGYTLTRFGLSLFSQLAPLKAWSEDWAQEVRMVADEQQAEVAATESVSEPDADDA